MGINNNNNNRNAQMLPQGLLHRDCVFPMPFTNNENPYNCRVRHTFPETRTMGHNLDIQPSTQKGTRAYKFVTESDEASYVWVAGTFLVHGHGHNSQTTESPQRVKQEEEVWTIPVSRQHFSGIFYESM
ncbi:hypothetical protein ACLKA7_017213 [Drosophila subpalustris]